jgi:hypothetical protein
MTESPYANLGRRFFCHPVNPVSNASPSSPEAQSPSQCRVMGGGPPAEGCRKRIEDVVVETVTLTVADADPFNTTGLGDTAQVDWAGAPAQEKATDWVKPPLGAMESEKEAVCPGATVTVVAELGAMEKSSPVPVRLTVCGFPIPLSLIVSVPVLTPLATGSKKTPIAHLEPDERLLPHELIWPKSEGLVVTPVMISGTVPVFMSVTVCGKPLVPTYWFGNVMLEGETLTMGVKALPVSNTAWGLSRALSVIVTEAVRVPELVGEKTTLIVQLASAITLVPQVLVCVKSPLLAPLMEIPLILRVPEPLLVRVIV